MWVFTTQGFYSVVRHRYEPDKLIVRGRAREDLEALRAQIPGLAVRSDRKADYRWRAIVSEAQWVAAVAQLAADIDYGNFKSAVGERQDPERAQIYSGVWGQLLGLQRDAD